MRPTVSTWEIMCVIIRSLSKGEHEHASYYYVLLLLGTSIVCWVCVHACSKCAHVVCCSHRQWEVEEVWCGVVEERHIVNRFVYLLSAKWHIVH